MEREKTYGGVDPEIFELMRGGREERREREGRRGRQPEYQRARG